MISCLRAKLARGQCGLPTQFENYDACGFFLDGNEDFTTLYEWISDAVNYFDCVLFNNELSSRNFIEKILGNAIAYS